MRKLIFVFIVFTVFHCETAAQFLSEPIINEVRMAKYDLLPESFLLSIPDSINNSIMHPALLNNVKTSYSYLTYFGNEMPYNIYQSKYGNWETISSCSFFPAFGHKWSLFIEHGTQRTSSTSDLDRYDGLRDIEESYQNHAFNLKISNIGGLTGEKSAIGIFFNFESNTYERISNLTSEITSYPLILQQRSEFSLKNNYKKFQTGLEYSTFSGRNIFTCQLAVQKCLPEIEVRYSNRTSDTNTSDLYSSIMQKNILLDYEPLTFSLKSKFVYKADILFSDDYFFVNGFAHYSNADASMEYVDFSYARENGGIIIDKRDYKIDTASKEKKWGLSATLGYSFNIKKSDISLISGIMANISKTFLSYYLFKRFYSDDFYYLTYKDFRRTSYDIILPLLINYSPAENISFYGGTICRYNWIRNDQYDTSYSFNNNQLSTILATNLVRTDQTSMIFKFGLDFTLAAKVRSSIIFTDDFSDYKSWNISIGYHF
ncbi:MAG: hypothetical protein V1720_22390 [bacterium]